MANSRAKVSYTAASGKTSLVDQMNMSIHLRKYVKLLTRRWIFLVLGAAIGSGYSWNKARSMPDEFYARSKVGVSPILSGVMRDGVIVQEEMARFYQTQIDYMTSDEVLGNVREKLKDKGSIPTTEMGTSSSILMHVRGNNFDACRRFAEEWADEFIAFKNRQKERLVNKEASDVTMRSEREKARLEVLRDEMDKFLAKNGANSKDVGDLAQSQLEQLKQRQLQLQFQRDFLKNQTIDQFLETKGTKTPAGGTEKKGSNEDAREGTSTQLSGRNVSAGDLRAIRKELLLLEVEIARYSNLKAKHPFMVNLNRKVEDLKAQMEIGRKLAEEDYQEQIKTLENSVHALEPMITHAADVVKDARQIQEEFRQMQLKYDEQSKTVDVLAAQVKLLKTVNTEDEKFYVMERGRGDANPTGPDRGKIILNGLMVGLIIGFGIIYLLHRMDDRLELAEDIEDELDEPVLGQVPQLPVEEAKDGVVLVTHLDQHNTFAESLRGVRSAFLFGSKDIPKQVLVVTSAVPGDGKTTITTNFATTLAKAGNKVLLVDADLRRGNIHSYFNLERANGFTEVLIGQTHWQDVVRQTSVQNLDTITTGMLPGNPGELLISPIAEQFITEARQSYDYILFDCPPLTSIDDTFCILSLVDSLLFVVKAGHTSMRFAKNALAQVRHRGANIVGIVLNGITTDHPGYYYYYYYHDYYKTAQDAKDKGQVLPDAQPGSKMARRKGRGDSAGEPLDGVVIEQVPAQDSPETKAKAFKIKRNIAKDDSVTAPAPAEIPPASDQPQA